MIRVVVFIRLVTGDGARDFAVGANVSYHRQTRPLRQPSQTPISVRTEFGRSGFFMARYERLVCKAGIGHARQAVVTIIHRRIAAVERFVIHSDGNALAVRDVRRMRSACTVPQGSIENVPARGYGTEGGHHQYVDHLPLPPISVSVL